MIEDSCRDGSLLELANIYIEWAEDFDALIRTPGLGPGFTVSASSPFSPPHDKPCHQIKLSKFTEYKRCTYILSLDASCSSVKHARSTSHVYFWTDVLPLQDLV